MPIEMDPFDINDNKGSSEEDMDRIIEESKKESVIKGAEYFEILEKYDIEKMINRIEFSNNVNKAENYIEEIKSSRKNIANYYDLKKSYDKKDDVKINFSEKTVEEKNELIKKVLDDAQINKEENNVKNLLEKTEDPEMLLLIVEELKAKIKEITEQNEISKEDFNIKKSGFLSRKKLSGEKDEAITNINNLESILIFTIREKEKRNLNKLVNSVNKLAERNEDKEELFEIIQEYIDKKKRTIRESEIGMVMYSDKEKIHRKAMEYVVEQKRIKAMLDKEVKEKN